MVRSFMAHHQGMSLLSLAYLLLDRPMQRRFVSDPLFQAADLLLQERVPKAGAVLSAAAEVAEPRTVRPRREAPMRVFTNPDTPTPEVHLLSNGRYHVMVTQRGRRLQPLAGPRGHPLARGSARATAGARSSTCATWRAANSGRPPISRR